ncbi:MAG: hypothetical protein HQK79_17710 [Desulfobacterales bacterium]|nr:hypothetical protein [Desulfobacterales bacterium]
MKIQIDLSGLQTILFAMLSCKCPVKHETENKLFNEYFSLKDQKKQLVDFTSILEIAFSNPERTPLHNLYEFCSYSKDDPLNFEISHNDVIRSLCSTFHFNLQSRIIDYRIVLHTASFLISHILIPVNLIKDREDIVAIFTTDNHDIVFKNIFIPNDLNLQENTINYGIHMGTVVSSLTEIQVQITNKHLRLIDQFHSLVKQIQIIDYSNFQYYGDYVSNVKERFKRCYKK